MAKTAAQALQNWQKGMANAGANFAAGTGAVTQSPMAAAAAQAAKAVQNYGNALNSGQWAAKLNATSLAYWKQQCAAAQQKLAMGAAKGATKYQAAIQALQPTYIAMKQASMSAGNDPGMKAAAAITVLVAAGKKGRAMGMAG